MHPIGRFYSSRTHPMPSNTEAWIERLPFVAKLELATALLNQCNGVYRNAPSLSVIKPELPEDHAS